MSVASTHGLQSRNRQNSGTSVWDTGTLKSRYVMQRLKEIPVLCDPCVAQVRQIVRRQVIPRTGTHALHIARAVKDKTPGIIGAFEEVSFHVLDYVLLPNPRIDLAALYLRPPQCVCMSGGPQKTLA